MADEVRVTFPKMDFVTEIGLECEQYLFLFCQKYEATGLAHCCECYILSNMKEVTEHGELRSMVLSEEGAEVILTLTTCCPRGRRVA